MSDHPAPPIRVFLDANVLFSAALSPNSGSSKLWMLSGVALVTSEQAAKEAWDNLGTARGRDKCDPVECRARLSTLLGGVEIVASEPERSSHIFCEWRLSDPDDEPILMDAINCRCQFLVSNDSACFGPFYGQTTNGVTVLSTGKFLNYFIGPIRPDAD